MTHPSESQNFYQNLITYQNPKFQVSRSKVEMGENNTITMTGLRGCTAARMAAQPKNSQYDCSLCKNAKSVFFYKYKPCGSLSILD